MSLFALTTQKHLKMLHCISLKQNYILVLSILFLKLYYSNNSVAGMRLERRMYCMSLICNQNIVNFSSPFQEDKNNGVPGNSGVRRRMPAFVSGSMKSLKSKREPGAP